MYKQQLSFHVVSKTFVTQNYLVFIPSNSICFSCPHCSFLACLAHFQPRDNQGKHNFEKETNYILWDFPDDLCHCLKGALTKNFYHA